MKSKALVEALNEQINYEYFASYQYLAMAAYFESAGLSGFASWMRAQSEEELFHAMKIFDFMHDRNARVKLLAIKEPVAEFSSTLDVFEKTLAHEQAVTASINALYELSLQEKDYPTQVMLQWFIEEQVEEEKTVQEIIDQLKLIGDDGTGLFQLDREMGARRGKTPENGNA